MSYKNAARIIDDMQEFLHSIRGHMEPSGSGTGSSGSENSSDEYSSAVPSETTLGLKQSNTHVELSGTDIEIKTAMTPATAATTTAAAPKAAITPEEDEDETISEAAAATASLAAVNEPLATAPTYDLTDKTQSPTVSAVLTIVRCTVCLEVPRGHTYQCARGHLICEVCLCYLIMNARKNGETGSCPTCRGIIRKEPSWRNNAIEDVAAELPCECKYCFKEFKIKFLTAHEENCCPLRVVKCKFMVFGCNWHGPATQQIEHENKCSIGKLPLVTTIEKVEDAIAREKRRCAELVEFLSGLGVEHVDLDLRPYVTLTDMKKVLYDSPTFKLLGSFWCISARVETVGPEAASHDILRYRLIWKTPRSGAITVRFLILKGPFNDTGLELKLHSHRFTDEQASTGFIDFPFASDFDFAKQISNSAVSFRFLMSWD